MTTAGDVRSDDGSAAEHGFDLHDAERLHWIDARQRKDVARRIETRQRLPFQVTEEHDAIPKCVKSWSQPRIVVFANNVAVLSRKRQAHMRHATLYGIQSIEQYVEPLLLGESSANPMSAPSKPCSLRKAATSEGDAAATSTGGWMTSALSWNLDKR